MNITFSAEEADIKRARGIAEDRGTTLNEEFRRWLRNFSTSAERVERLRKLFEETGDWSPGRTFTREERNAR